MVLLVIVKQNLIAKQVYHNPYAIYSYQTELKEQADFGGFSWILILFGAIFFYNNYNNFGSSCVVN